MEWTGSVSREEINKEFPLKVELHVHLEGSVRYETIQDLARKRGLEPLAKTLEDLKDRIIIRQPADSLTQMLEAFSIFTPSFEGYHEGVYRVAYEFCEDAAKQGVLYSEVRYSPHLISRTHASGRSDPEEGPGVSYTPRDVVVTVNQALKDGGQKFNVTVKSILCCIRHFPQWSQEVVDLCAEFADQGVVAMDIAGPEVGSIVTDTDQSLHLAAFREANKRGLQCIAHAGEAGPPENILLAVEGYGVTRVGHGYSCPQDEGLFRRLVKDGVHFETCPISSILTRAAPNGTVNHPIVKMAKEGACFSINSDDPTVFGNCLADDYACALHLGLSKSDIVNSIFNAVKASFASDEEKKRLTKELTAVYGER